MKGTNWLWLQVAAKEEQCASLEAELSAVAAAAAKAQDRVRILEPEVTALAAQAEQAGQQLAEATKVCPLKVTTPSTVCAFTCILIAGCKARGGFRPSACMLAADGAATWTSAGEPSPSVGRLLSEWCGVQEREALEEECAKLRRQAQGGTPRAIQSEPFAAPELAALLEQPTAALQAAEQRSRDATAQIEILMSSVAKHREEVLYIQVSLHSTGPQFSLGSNRRLCTACERRHAQRVHA